MNARAISLTIVAFLLGALAAGGIGVRVIREVRTDPDATSLPQSNITPDASRAPFYQVDPNETLLASTALVPESIDIEDETLRITYDLISLAPQAGAGSGATTSTDIAVVYPRTWVVLTRAGAVAEATSALGSRFVQFDVDQGTEVSDIVSVSITEASAPYPIEISFTLSESSSVVDLGFGATAELVEVVVDGSTTVVHVAVTSSDERPSDLSISAIDPRWTTSVSSDAAGGSVTLRWSDGQPPDDIRLRAVGSVMVPIDGDFAVS
ncbi:MAG: hypothetical protein GWP18_04545 [Proteobacteria bacterium]|nr:hypothetical protein [Pseudomonadota bacterium]